MAYPPPFYPTHSFHSPTRPPLQPYLGPRALLSLSWLSQHFLALILVFITLTFLLSNIAELVADAKQSLAASCAGVEGAANVLVSLPHYTASGINELNQKSVAAVTSGAATFLDLTLIGITQIILFMIDLYRSLFLCLMNLAVHGGLTLLIDATEEIGSFVTSTFQSIRSEVQSAVGVINEGLDKTLGLIDDIPGVNFDIPQVDIPSLDFLTNVTLPSGIVDGLTSLNDSIPTLDELRASLNSLISTPVDELRATINSTLANATIDVELLPIPAKESVELCTNLDTSFLDDVGHDLAKFIKIALGLIALLAVLLIIASALFERWQYRNFLEGVARARESWLIDLGHSPAAPSTSVDAREALSNRNLLSFLSASNHPTLSLLLSRLANALHLRSATRSNLYWFGSYIFHPSALAFLALGTVGLVVVQVQLAVLEGPIKTMAQSRASEGAGEFSTSVLGTINGKMSATSVEWAEGSNKVIGALQEGINDDLFGWVNTTTEAMNSTINTFYTGITDTLTDVFNGTVLQDPILGLVYCLIGSKVDAISTALTWIHSHAHINLPLVSPDALLLSQSQSDDLTSDLTNPDSSVSTTSLVDRMIATYARSLEQQRLGFIVCLVIWGVVVLCALGGLWWEMQGAGMWAGWRDRRRGRGGAGPNSAKGEEGDEKGHLRPLHLRSESLLTKKTEQTKEKAAAAAAFSFPSPPLLPPPPRRGSPSPSSASWGSLVDFFRPGAVVEAATTSSSTPSHLAPPSLPRLLSRPHFPAGWEPATAPPPRNKEDPFSDDRAYPALRGDGTQGGRKAPPSSSSRLAGVMRGFKLATTPARARKRRSGSNWGGSARWERLPDVATRHAVQQPLSPPPHPYTNTSTTSGLDTFPPLQPERQASSYHPSSSSSGQRRPSNSNSASMGVGAGVNPFATPFDGPGEG